ncbi:uncharacterized protein LOC129959563 [Argiope bruennichi]|uniref:uncharacterized protein LOC129959563 n=1 Tax=Argiope bruennichi TaxID=94029 RepID=UPI00249558EF|nr:uncharacterized protein LOC129959563 [Argiope bruennichi]
MRCTKMIVKTRSSNSGFSFDDSEFPLLSSFPTAFVSSAWPKQGPARPVSRHVQPTRPVSRPKQESAGPVQPARLISTPMQQSAALLTEDISSLPSSKVSQKI